ncbi:MAG: hypothetical protein AMXMBFR82_47940 [Candidatus Hydrogenedentota bacterium]
MKHIKALTKVDPRMAQLNTSKCDTILKTPEEKDAKKEEKQQPA